MDEISRRVLKIIEKSEDPLETAEIVRTMPDTTRTKILNRLKDLRGDGKIKGKRVGAGTKGTWIWWAK